MEDDGELVYADRTLLTVNQVAAATGYNKQTISRFCIAGRIRATREMLVNRIGSRYPAWMIEARELIRFQRNGCLAIDYNRNNA